MSSVRYLASEEWAEGRRLARENLREAFRQTSMPYLVRRSYGWSASELLALLTFDFDAMTEAHMILGRLCDMIVYARDLEERLNGAQPEDDIPF